MEDERQCRGCRSPRAEVREFGKGREGVCGKAEGAGTWQGHGQAGGAAAHCPAGGSLSSTRLCAICGRPSPASVASPIGATRHAAIAQFGASSTSAAGVWAGAHTTCSWRRCTDPPTRRCCQGPQRRDGCAACHVQARALDSVRIVRDHHGKGAACATECGLGNSQAPLGRKRLVVEPML